MTAPSPLAKRRRWLIAVVLLFVVSVAGLRSWPREDARFVGLWEVRGRNRDGSNSREKWRLKSAGGGSRQTDNSAATPLVWSVENEELLIDFRRPTGWTGLQLAAEELWNRITGKISTRNPTRFKVHLAIPDEIAISYFQAGVSEGFMSMRRVPE